MEQVIESAMKGLERRVKIAFLDFDGPIALTLPLNVENYGRLHSAEGLPPPTPEQIEHWRDMNAFRVMIDILGFSKLHKIPEYWKRASEMLFERKDEIAVKDGVGDVLEKLKENGYGVYIVSSNREALIEYVLNKGGIRYDGVYTTERFTSGDYPPHYRLFGKHLLLEIVMEEKGLGASEAVMVGDEIRDKKECQKAGINNIILVSWGYQSERALLKSGIDPYFVVPEPNQILERLDPENPLSIEAKLARGDMTGTIRETMLSRAKYDLAYGIQEVLVRKFFKFNGNGLAPHT